MKKLATIALTIALMSLAANAAIITVDPPVILTAADGYPGFDPTGLRQYTFNLVDDGEQTVGPWAVDIWVVSELGGSGIFNINAFGGGLTIDDHPNADIFNSDANLYNKAADTWLANGFGWLPLPITHLISGPHQGFMPEIHVTASSGNLGSAPFLQVVTDGDLRWYGRDKQTGDVVAGEIGRDGRSHPSEGTTIPEPATMGLMLFGAISVIARKRRS